MVAFEVNQCFIPWPRLRNVAGCREQRVIFRSVEQEIANHSSFLAWEIPRTEEPGRLQSMWSQRVRHALATTQQQQQQQQQHLPLPGQSEVAIRKTGLELELCRKNYITVQFPQSTKKLTRTVTPYFKCLVLNYFGLWVTYKKLYIFDVNNLVNQGLSIQS